jgi:alcohol dehydrogenase (NADP+)
MVSVHRESGASVTFAMADTIRLDVDIKIEACGICGSDVHTISGKT